MILECAKHNKKILCEKPIGLNLDQANLALKAIKEKNIMFFEAIAYRSHIQTKKIIELINSDEIGDILRIEALFGFKVNHVKKDSRLFISVPWGSKCEFQTLGLDKNVLFNAAYLISFSVRA